MHHSEIIESVVVEDSTSDLETHLDVGDRPILACSFAVVDGSDILVPVDVGDMEGHILALTEKQGAQLLVVLASQIGKSRSLLMIEELT